MTQNLHSIDHVLDCLRDKQRESSQEIMRSQIRILAMKLASGRFVPDADTCLEGCQKSLAGCTLCWIRWSKEQALETVEDDDDE